MNREIFDTYIETQLAPTLQQGDVVILDNLSSHKSAKAEAVLASAELGSSSCRLRPDLVQWIGKGVVSCVAPRR